MSDEPVPRVEQHDAVSVIRLGGEVGIVQAQTLRDRLFAAVRNQDLGLVIDLSDTTYIDSDGVNLLFELAERLAERQIRLGVVMPDGGLVERVLTIVDLEAVAEVRRTMDEAVDAVTAD
jgi:anti-anti-sigma factor